MSPVAHASDLLAEAEAANERRIVVLTGDRSATYRMADRLLGELPIGIADTVAVSERTDWTCTQIAPERSTAVMGRTLGCVVLDLFDMAAPNAIGRATGAVDGGGLLIVLCPALDAWPSRRDAFDRRLVVKPFALEDVSGHFRRHLVTTLRTHPGIAIVDTDGERVRRPGLTDPAPAEDREYTASPPAEPRLVPEAYRQCATRDQRRTLVAFEELYAGPTAVVVSAPRGRGKTAAVGLAAVSMAAQGRQVGITAPSVENVRAAFDHGAQLAEALALEVDRVTGEEPRLQMERGAVAFHPLETVDPAGELDVLFVDEAAGVPVPRLEALLAQDCLGLTTTRHGYEGTGQGFATRFRERLEASEHRIVEREMHTPIRYAPDDPIEAWLNRGLWLDARPAPAEAVSPRSPAELAYRRWEGADLLAQPETFREVVGLLAQAHYRTEPDDVARILDAPNLELVTLNDGDLIVSVALIAREGDLDPDDRERAYRGERLRGNMLPDIFINEFRDTRAAARPGLRVVRIATHPAVRRQGYASRLLSAIDEDLGRDAAWWGTAFGVTPELVPFWRANGFVPIFLGATRNRASGVHSVAMLHRSAGRWVERFAEPFAPRLQGSLLDVHRELDPDAILALVDAMETAPPLELTDVEWRGLAAASHGPGRYDLDPAPTRQLVMHHLAGGNGPDGEVDERLLVSKVLQGRSWAHVAEALAYPSTGAAKRALGAALAPLVDEYGGAVVAAERARLAGGDDP